MMNPNDPMENPEAFNKVVKNVYADEVKSSHNYSHKASSSSMEKGSHELLKNNSTRHLQRRRSRESKDSFKSEFGNEKSNVDHSVINKTSQSDHKRNMSKGGSGNIGSFSSSNYSRHGNRSHSFNNHVVIFLI
jgi:RPM1-interacting protein 4